ncbi:hypothetical protein GWI33_008951 [Rhynchophorus ferrugineus]|uniref:tRNA (adenine(58)-N(1))-methyltransferase n=1 Tax=Rhynchophorus ferrugineus TaxID=354439 RepID=A0A834IFG7_RHYFE|nr:hypothetical protein GWI33_008951 [Rhynchophorus ferrugineus]
MIILQLEISPGSIVIESGTDSGSLSPALTRAIKPHGHLYTFGFHEVRTKTALWEFKDNYVSVNHRDVCTNGFGDELNGKADAVFLDLPYTWLAIHHSVKSLKETGGRICSFPPRIEQVQKTCQELSNLGFQEIQTMEVLQTQYNVQTRNIPVLDTEFLKTPKLENVEKKERDTIKFNTAVQPAQQPGHTGESCDPPPFGCSHLCGALTNRLYPEFPFFLAGVALTCLAGKIHAGRARGGRERPGRCYDDNVDEKLDAAVNVNMGAPVGTPSTLASAPARSHPPFPLYVFFLYGGPRRRGPLPSRVCETARGPR